MTDQSTLAQRSKIRKGKRAEPTSKRKIALYSRNKLKLKGTCKGSNIFIDILMEVYLYACGNRCAPF